MDTTAVAWTVRGFKLRAVDDALKSYWDSGESKEKRGTLRRALGEWIGEVGPNWRSHERNVNDIVALLRGTLQEQVQFTPADFTAFQYQDEMRALRMQKIFNGKEIVWKAFNDTTAGLRKALEEMEEVKKGNDGKLDPDMARMRSQLQNRNDFQNGKWNAARGVINGIGGPAAGIQRLVAQGAGAVAGEQTLGVAGASSGANEFKELITQLFGGVHSPKDISFHLLKETGLGLDDMARSVVPLISCISSGVSMVVSWIRLAKAVYQQRDVGSQKSFVNSGDMGEAFEALERLLLRKVHQEEVSASIQTADFTARAAASCADFGVISGSVIGVVSSLSKLVQKLYLLGREYFETRAARTLLAQGIIDCRLFNAYPLMGAYMLACSDLSEIIVMTRAEQIKQGVLFGAEGWMDDVEYIKKKHIDPIMKAAASLMNSSPFFIPDMPLHTAYNPDFFNKFGQRDGKFRLCFNAVRLASAAT